MKKIITLSVSLLCICFTTNASNINFGQPSSGAIGSTFFDFDGAALTPSTGVIVFGAFDSVSYGSNSAIANETDVVSLFNAFNDFGESNQLLVSTIDGLFTGSLTTTDTSSNGLIPHILILSGVTTFEDASMATGYAVVQSSEWGSLSISNDIDTFAYTTDLVDSNAEVIVGNYSPDGSEFSSGLVSLAPVPEPAEIGLILGLAVLGIGYYRKRR